MRGKFCWQKDRNFDKLNFEMHCLRSQGGIPFLASIFVNQKGVCGTGPMVGICNLRAGKRNSPLRKKPLARR
jgi:hypothetical protein